MPTRFDSRAFTSSRKRRRRRRRRRRRSRRRRDTRSGGDTSTPRPARVSRTRSRWRARRRRRRTAADSSRFRLRATPPPRFAVFSRNRAGSAFARDSDRTATRGRPCASPRSRACACTRRIPSLTRTTPRRKRKRRATKRTAARAATRRRRRFDPASSSRWTTTTGFCVSPRRGRTPRFSVPIFYVPRTSTRRPRWRNTWACLVSPPRRSSAATFFVDSTRFRAARATARCVASSPRSVRSPPPIAASRTPSRARRSCPRVRARSPRRRRCTTRAFQNWWRFSTLVRIFRLRRLTTPRRSTRSRGSACVRG